MLAGRGREGSAGAFRVGVGAVHRSARLLPPALLERTGVDRIEAQPRWSSGSRPTHEHQRGARREHGGGTEHQERHDDVERVALGDRRIMASDTMKGDAYAGMHGFSIALSYPSVDAAKKVFAALSEGGKVNMPMGPTFWVESFGMAVDRFGTAWMVSGGKPAQG